MKAAFYLGTHGTEPERTVRALMDNRAWMLDNGIEPIPPSRHRGLLEEALAALTPAQAERLENAGRSLSVRPALRRLRLRGDIVALAPRRFPRHRLGAWKPLL